MIKKISDFLLKEINPLPLDIFRLIFGFVLCYQFYYYISIDYIHQFITGPQILFKYPLLEFLQAGSERTLTIILYLMFFLSALIALGIKTRWASILLFPCFFYFTFIDQTLYNNHLYLFLIIIGLFSFIINDKSLTISSIIKKEKNHNERIPNWSLFLLQFIIFCTYFFGGIAKLNADWISCDLPKLLLSSKIEHPSKVLIYFISYGGLLFDLSIGLLLWYKRTFFIALFAVFFFNIMNGLFLFDDIGVFPLFMVGATVLFIPQTIFARFTSEKKLPDFTRDTTNPIKKNNLALGLSLVFIVFNLLFPLRHYLFTPHPEWTGLGAKFSWRMKMQSNSTEHIKLMIRDEASDVIHPIEYESFLTANQKIHFLDDPMYVVQLAHFLHQEGTKRGMVNPVITGDIRVSMNGRPSQPMVYTDIDLATVPIDRWEIAKIVQPLVVKQK